MSNSQVRFQNVRQSLGFGLLRSALLWVVTGLCVVAGVGCSSLYNWVVPEPSALNHPVDFQSAVEFAERADAAYATQGEIEQRYPELQPLVRQLPNSEVQYFVLFDDVTGTQHIAIRGTSNLANVKVDAQFDPQPDTRLGIHFHSGFAVAGRQLYADLRPHLKENYATTLTGTRWGGPWLRSLASI